MPNPSLPLQEIVVIRISIAEIVCGASKMSGCQEKSEFISSSAKPDLHKHVARKIWQKDFEDIVLTFENVYFW